LLKRLAKDGFDVDGPLEESNKKVIQSLLKIFAVII
jgi:hypothetical protein